LDGFFGLAVAEEEELHFLKRLEVTR